MINLNNILSAPSNSDDYLIKTYPCLNNPETLTAYKLFLFYAGHCPECNDLLFPKISINHNGTYTLIYECMNDDCNYSKNVSGDFNNYLGIKYVPNDLEDEQDTNNHNIRNIPHVYYSLNDVYEFIEKEKVTHSLMELISNSIGECPICTSSKFEVSVYNNIPNNRMEAKARCTYCNSLFDVTDFYAYGIYKHEFPDILEEKYNIKCLSDCKVKFLRKDNIPHCTGTLKKSFMDVNNRNAVGKKSMYL